MHACAGVGDLTLAYQAFKVAVSLDATHIEALTNLGVLEVRKSNDDAAYSYFQSAQKLAEHAFEPWYNGALDAQSRAAVVIGNLQDSYRQIKQALVAFPEHIDGQELMKHLKHQFSTL